MANSRRGPRRRPLDRGTRRGRFERPRNDVTSEVLRVIAGYKSGDRAIKAGNDLFRPGEPCDAIYALVEGWIFLHSLLEDGRRQILHFALPGAVLGLYPARVTIATYGAQALTDAVVCVIPHQNLGRLSKEHPEIWMQLAAIVSHDRNLAYDHLSSIGRRSARERVARLLLELFARYRMQWPGHRVGEMHLPLTQEHIGDATGLTGVHVNRVLGSLRKDGIVGFHYRRLRILNPDKLFDVAGIDPQTIFSWIGRYPSE